MAHPTDVIAARIAVHVAAARQILIVVPFRRLYSDGRLLLFAFATTLLPFDRFRERFATFLSRFLDCVAGSDFALCSSHDQLTIVRVRPINKLLPFGFDCRRCRSVRKHARHNVGHLVDLCLYCRIDGHPGERVGRHGGCFVGQQLRNGLGIGCAVLAK